MIYFENKSKYADGLRDCEQHFLDIVSCTEYRFLNEDIKKIIPGDKYELFYVKNGSVRINETEKEVTQNGILLLRKFSSLTVHISKKAEIIEKI